VAVSINAAEPNDQRPEQHERYEQRSMLR
jgi:hypothetical protein